MELQAAERRLAELGRVATRARAQLAVRRQALTAVTGALQTMVRRPPEAFVSGAFSALEMARTSALLDGAATRIAAAAGALRAQLATVAQTKAAIRVEQANLAVAVAAYERSAAGSTDCWPKRPGCWPPSAPPTRPGKRGWRRWPARPAICVGCWNNCPSIAGPKGAPPTVWRRWPCQSRRREPGRPAAPPPTAPGGLFTQSILARKGQLPAPVIGRVVQGFGRRDGRGQITKGVAIRSRAGAPVVAPFDGRVLYAGPFRSYGLILIIDHGQGYHTLLAGLGRLHMAVGQTVLAGEPIGVMARDNELSADRLDLYLELRHDGTPIDPLPWLALETGIASG